MRQNKISRGSRLLTTLLLPAAGIALLILLMSHRTEPVRAGGANVWWVDGGAGNDGNSCLTPDAPCATIGGAVTKATADDLIHVSAGTYAENLVITKSLALVGGFDEEWLRDSGDRTMVHPSGGRVLEINHSQRITVSIVGFTLTGGTTEENSGAGLFADDARVTMADCAVTGNENRGIQWGGGIYFAAVEAQLTDVVIYNNTISGTTGLALGGGIALRFGSDVTIADSRIISNSAGGGAGGIYVGDIFGDGSRLTLLRSEVLNNTGGGNGGGLRVDSGNINASHLTLSANLFQDNSAQGSGGAVYAVGDEGGLDIYVTATANRVFSNTAASGGGWYLAEYVVAALNGDSFRGNSATVGGGLYLEEGIAVTSTFRGLQFTDNEATSSGGGLYVASQATLVKAELQENSAGVAGGGLYVASGRNHRVGLETSRVISNSAATGGGIAVSEVGGGALEVYRVHLAGNESSGDGGAIGVPNPYSVLTMTNSVLLWNQAAGDGGGLFFTGDEVRIINNTLVGDVPSSSHGLYLDLADGGSVLLYNNILVGHAVGVSKTATGSLDSDYNAFWDNGTHYDVSGQNIGSQHPTVDPEFADRTGGDLHLTNSSPSGSSGVRDRASSNYAPGDDYDGQSRPYNDNDDKGADEYRPSGGCSDDTREENDSAASAASLNAGTYNNLQICPGDPDWYRVQVPRGVQLTADLDFNHNSGDLDVILLDGDLRPLDAGHSSDNDEQVSVVAPLSGTYYLHVYGLDLGMGGAQNSYNLVIDLDACPDDGYEENDALASAATLGDGTHTGLDICPYDPDFYRFTLPTTKTLTVTLSHDAGQGDLDLWLYSPSGVYTASSLTLADQESVYITTLGSSKEVFIRVCGYADGQCGPTPVENDYTLDLLMLNNGPGVELSPDRSSDADPGEAVVYEHTLRNMGNEPDSFTLSYVSDQGWDVDLSTPPALGPGETATVQVTVHVPASTAADTEDRTTVTATSQRNNAFAASVIDTTTVNYVADIVWDSAATNGVVPPDTLVYSHQLTNDGNADDTFDLEIDAPAGITPSLSTYELSLNRGASDSVDVTLEIGPYPAVQNGRYDVTLTATSQRDPGASETLVDHVDVNVDLGVTFDAPVVYNNVAPATTLIHTHTLTNTGNVTDRFTINLVSAPAEIDVSLEPGSANFTLGPDDDATFTVTLDVTGYPNISTGSYDVQWEAVSDYDEDVNTQVTDQVNVVVSTGVNLDESVSFAHTRPLSTVHYSHVVSNMGNVTDAFTLNLNTVPELSATAGQYSLLLGPFDAATVPITVEIGDYPPVLSGTYPITLGVTSDYDAGVNDQVVDQVQVDVPTGVTFDALRRFDYTRPLSTVVYSHVLTNTGDYDDQFGLLAQSPPGITVTLSQDSFALAPGIGASVVVTLNMGPYPEVISRTYNITLTAVSDWDPSASAQVVDQAHVDVLAGLAWDDPIVGGPLQPPSQLVYSHVVSNVGEFGETVALTAMHHSGISVTFSADQFYLEPYEGTSVSITLDIGPYPTIISGTYPITLAAQSVGNPDAKDEVVDRVDVDVETGVTFDAAVTQANVVPPTVLDYVHTLTNTGNVADRFTVSVVDPPSGIDVSLSETQFALDPGGDATFTVTLDVTGYPDVSAGLYDISLNVVSDYDPAVNHQVVDQVDVDVETGVTFDAAVTQADVVPPAVLDYVHTLTNTGNVADRFTVGVVDSPTGIDVSLSETKFALDPGGDATFTVMLDVTGYPDIRAGLYDISLQVVSDHDPAVNHQVVDQVDVDAAAGVALDAPVVVSTPPAQQVTYVHRLTNHGNVADAFMLSASAPAGITPNLSVDQLLLGPGATQPFTVTLDIADSVATGVYSITVEAVSLYDVAVRTSVVDRIEVIRYTILLPIVVKNTG